MKKEFMVITLFALLIVSALFIRSKQAPVVSMTPVQAIAQAPSAVSKPASSTNIEVMMPKNGDLISSPVLITGNARVFEGNVSIRLLDENGDVLAYQNADAKSPNARQFGPFEANLVFDAQESPKGSIEVYQISQKDGSEIDKVIIPVSFR